MDSEMEALYRNGTRIYISGSPFSILSIKTVILLHNVFIPSQALSCFKQVSNYELVDCVPNGFGG